MKMLRLYTYTILSLLLYLGHIPSAAQSILYQPPVIWLKPKAVQTEGLLSEEGQRRNLSFPILNFHQVPTFETSSFAPAVKLENTSLTIFLVYQDLLPGAENWLIELTDASQPVLEITDHRFVNMSDSTSYRLHGLGSQWFRLSTIFTHLPNSQSDSRTLRIGTGTNSQYDFFSGLMPEVLVFDQMLSKRERQKVESYLSIKYGIPMFSNRKLVYLNSEGQVYWSAPTSSPFRYNIAGIGRDDNWGLYQKQANSAYEANLISIGLKEIKTLNASNSNQLPNLSFLLWSDNQKPLAVRNGDKAHQHLLEREWQVKPSNFPANTATALRLGFRQIKEELPKNHQYWLAIDRTGTGTFPVEETDYFWPTSNSKSAKFSTYEDIVWDADQSGSDIFSLRPGPPMIVSSDVKLPSCALPRSGKLGLKVQGGSPPYFIHIKNQMEETQTKERWSGAYLELDQLPAGEYVLQVLDNNGAQYQDTFHLQAEDLFTSLTIAGQYQLPAEGPLVLTVPQVEQDVYFRWLLPNGTQEIGQAIEIREAGRYGLQAEKADCQGSTYFEVQPNRYTSFQSVELWNNPSLKGNFTLEIRLWQVNDVQLSIYDDMGRLVRSKQLTANHYYLFQDDTLLPGTYRIQVQTATEKQTKTLILF